MRRKPILFLAVLFIMGLAAMAQAQPYPPQPPPDQPYPPGPPERGGYISPQRHAPQGHPYFILQGGVFSPNDDEEGLRGYDTGWNFDVGIGSRVSPFLAIEGMVGAYGAENGPNELRVVPVTVGGRFVLPGPFIEPYFGVGIGFNFSSLEEVPVGLFSGIDDTSTDFGGYVSLGVDAWLNYRTAFNLEAKYRMGNPSFTTNAGNEIEVDVSGWTLDLGLRLEF